MGAAEQGSWASEGRRSPLGGMDGGRVQRLPHKVMMALLTGKWQKTRPARQEGVSEVPVEPSMLEGGHFFLFK